MKKNVLHSLVALFFITVANAQINKQQLLQTINKVTQWQIEQFSSPQPAMKLMGLTDWENGALYTGIVDAYKLTNNKEYYNFLYNIGEKVKWNTGAERFFADDYCIGQMYAQMYMWNKQPKTIARFLLLADSIVAQQHTEPLEWTNKIWNREWAWCDALFMGPPSLAYLSTATGDKKYVEKADTLWWKTTAFLYDTVEHLYSRDSRFKTKLEANGKKVFWSRGNGWVIAAITKMLEQMPAKHPSRKKYEMLFVQMAKKIASIQTADGSWRASLLDPASYSNKESSGTAFFTYAMAWGINNNLLSKKEYYPVIVKAWKMLETCVHENGKVGFIQLQGDQPRKTDFETTQTYGVGAFLLAATQLYHLENRKK